MQPNKYINSIKKKKKEGGDVGSMLTTDYGTQLRFLKPWRSLQNTVALSNFVTFKLKPLFTYLFTKTVANEINIKKRKRQQDN